MSQKRTYKQYSKEYKDEAVALVKGKRSFHNVIAISIQH